MFPTMNVRPEAPADHGKIRAVHTASFPTVAEACLVDDLRAAGRLRVSLVAEDQGDIVGHVAFSPVSVIGATDGVGLGPVSVLPAFRRRGIAHQLIREGLAVCEGLKHGFVVVLGDPRYYGRFRFTPASDRGLRDEYGGGDAFQVLELLPGAIPAGGGVVRYSPEFAVVDGESTA